MSKLFDLDSPIIQVLNKVADLMWLNILTLICCIPVFTIGAALTSAHYVALKMRRNEEGYISRDFFKAFKLNFKQSTLIWLLAMLLIGILVGDLYIMKNNTELEIHNIVRIVIMAAGILVTFTLMWVFALQAKFSNTIRGTIKNAFAISVLQFPKTILMIIMAVIPVVLYAWSLRTFPIVLLFGISAPIYVSALLYNKTFKRLEDQILERLAAEKEGAEGTENEEAAEEDEKIFRDQLMDEDKK